MNYAQQAHKPEWYKADNTKLYHAATSGSSPLNEWYEFDNREDAIDLINSAFESQSFIDSFSFFNGDYYREDEIIWDGDSIQNLVNLQPAEIGEMVDAESRF